MPKFQDLTRGPQRAGRGLVVVLDSVGGRAARERSSSARAADSASQQNPPPETNLPRHATELFSCLATFSSPAKTIEAF